MKEKRNGHSEKTKEKQRASQLEYFKNNPTDKRRVTKLNVMFGKNHTEQSKNKHKETLKNKPILVCPNCGFSSNNYGCIKQFHFMNCKKEKLI